MSGFRPDGTPKRSNLLQALEIDAVELLRNPKNTGDGMRDRLNARHYLISVQGWTPEEVDAARDAPEENRGLHAV